MDSSSRYDRYFPIITEDNHALQKCRRNPWHKPSACYEMAKRLYEDGFEKYRRPIGTLYAGSMGVRAYVRYRLAKLLKVMDDEEETYRHKIEKVLDNAYECAYAYTKDRSLEQPGTIKNLHRITLLESTYVGAKALVVAITHAQGKYKESNQTAKWLIADLRSMGMSYPTSECEVLYGRAGALTAILFLRTELNDPTLGTEFVCDLAMQILQEGMNNGSAASKKSNTTTNTTSSIPPPRLTLLWEWHRKAYLGAAHGVTGILQTLLSLHPSEIQKINSRLQIDTLQLIFTTIEEMNAQCCFESGNLKSSWNGTSTMNRKRAAQEEEDRLVQWCHGAPGHVLLLLKAYDVTRKSTYLDMAEHITENVIWPRGLLRKGIGLCHGISGNAYVFLAVHARVQQQQQISRSETESITPTATNTRSENSTTNARYLEYARTYVEFAVQNLETLEPIPDRPYSLYEGSCGLAVLLMDLAQLAIDPQYQARFPLYEF